MARLGINTGTAPNDGTGDTLFQAGDKTNKNFSELYNFLGNGTDLASGFVTSITGAGNISVTGTSDVTLTGIAATSDINADRLVVTGVSTLTNQVKIVSDDSSPGRIDYYCETSNAHYTRVQAAPHAQYSGNATVTLPTSDGTILLTDGDGSALSGIVTTIVAGSNISINSGSGSVQISASSGAAVTDLQIGYASTAGDTPRVVGTSVTQVNFVGTGYTVTVANNVATVRNLGMGLTTLNITSAGYGATIFAGNQISYTAVASDANAKFYIEDNAGIQIGINYDSGIMGGGQNASAGTYDVKLRAATFFGMSEPKNVRFVISPFTLTMDTMFGGTDSYVVMTDTDDNATFVSLSTYGVVAYDGANYVIDRDASVYSDAAKHALYYDNSNNELYGYRRESDGNMTIRKWTSVSSAADGTNVGSGTQIVLESVCDQTLTEQSALRNGKDYSTLTLDAGIDDFDGVYNRQSFKANLDTGTASSGNALFNATNSYWWFLKNGDNSRMIIYDTVNTAWTYVYVSGANFSTAADGTAVGSPNAVESQSISDAVYGGGAAVQPASEYSEITYGAGTGIGNGAYQPFGNYTHLLGGAFAMKITTTGGLMNNFGTKASPDAGWSYGFTLEDPWVATGAGQQMLSPESASDGWHAFAPSIFLISFSIYDYVAYGDYNSGPYTSSTGVSLAYQQSSANIANAGDTIQVRWDGTTYKMYINGVEKISTTSPGTYMSSSATTNPVLTFGDTSSMNGGTIINDYGDPAPWPFRIRDLWIANNGNISASDCVGVSTFRDRNIASWSEYSDVDVYITMDGSGVTAVKGSPTVERKSITFS